MTNLTSISTTNDGSLPRPRSFRGDQPVVAVARYRSKLPCDWNILYHLEGTIYEPFSGSKYLELYPTDVDSRYLQSYDYDFDDINRFFMEELENDGGCEVTWANICDMHRADEDPLHILRGRDTEVDANNRPTDCYWEVGVLNRDDADFWIFLLTDSPDSIGITWQPRQESFSNMVLDWLRENPVRAQEWLNASPSPAELIGESDELTQLIKKLKRAIKQGNIPLD